MANQVAARLSGDDYQHLYAWMFVLELLMPRHNVRRVTVEDALAGSVDDVTVQHEIGTATPDRFYQVKYHVDQRGEYSTQVLIDHKLGEASLLEKFWQTWKSLRNQDPNKSIELHLVSNWSWDASDKFKSCIDGHDNSIKEAFLTSSPRSDLGKLRQRWQTALSASDTEFQAFIRCLRFRLGFDCADELEKRVVERMEYLHLKSDVAALHVATGIVRTWIKAGTQELLREDVARTLREHDLYMPEEQERCVTVYLTTIKAQRFDLDPDHVIDWRDHFVGDPNKKGHQLHDPAEWNRVLLPQLQGIEAQINQETDCRLVRARGLARLSAWFAFGFSFSEVARYTIEVDQNGQLWRTDAAASTDFLLQIGNPYFPEGEVLDGEGSTVAVGISITGSLDNDVRDYLAGRTEQVAALLLLRPERELGRDCLRSAGDVIALADQAKGHLRALAKRWQAKRLLLFYFGPLSAACFLGHRLNAVCQEIQIMEDQQPGYAPSFILK